MLTLGLLHLYILNKSEIYFLSMPFENKRHDNQKYDRFNKTSASNNLVLEKHLELASVALKHLKSGSHLTKVILPYLLS